MNMVIRCRVWIRASWIHTQAFSALCGCDLWTRPLTALRTSFQSTCIGIDIVGSSWQSLQDWREGCMCAMHLAPHLAPRKHCQHSYEPCYHTPKQSPPGEADSRHVLTDTWLWIGIYFSRYVVVSVGENLCELSDYSLDKLSCKSLSPSSPRLSIQFLQGSLWCKLLSAAVQNGGLKHHARGVGCCQEFFENVDCLCWVFPCILESCKDVHSLILRDLRRLMDHGLMMCVRASFHLSKWHLRFHLHQFPLPWPSVAVAVLTSRLMSSVPCF